MRKPIVGTELRHNITLIATEASHHLALHVILDLHDTMATWQPFTCSLTTASPPEEKGKDKMVAAMTH